MKRPIDICFIICKPKQIQQFNYLPATTNGQQQFLYWMPWFQDYNDCTEANLQHLWHTNLTPFSQLSKNQYAKKKKQTLDCPINLQLRRETIGRNTKQLIKQLTLRYPLFLWQNLKAHLHHLPHCIISPNKARF